MTATVGRVPEIEDVLRRADARLADSCGDDRLPPDHIATFARAVEGLLKKRPPASADPADPAELEQLRQRLADADRQLEIANAEIQRLTTEVPALEARAEKLGQERDTEAAEAKRLAGLLEEQTRAEAALVAEMRATIDVQTATTQRLTAEVEMLREQLRDANADASALGIEVAALAEQQPRHVHRYEWPDPAQAPRACSCGRAHPWVALAAAELVAQEDPPETGPWDEALRDRIRAELAGWPG